MLLVYADRIEQSFRGEYLPLAIIADDDLISSLDILGEKGEVLLEESDGRGFPHGSRAHNGVLYQPMQGIFAKATTLRNSSSCTF
jgi:hypothetical protein